MPLVHIVDVYFSKKWYGVSFAWEMVIIEFGYLCEVGLIFGNGLQKFME